MGVLRAIARIRRESGVPRRRNRFKAICGSSAGAINAASLACNADQFDAAVAGLAAVCERLPVEQVFRADPLGLIHSGEHVSFYQAAVPVAPWLRAQRVALPVQRDVAHRLASSAIPFVFPAIELQIAGRTQ